MTLEKKVFSLISLGYAPAEVRGKLGISRYQYDGALAGLVDRGALGKWGQLPDGAEAEMCPSNIVATLFSEFLESANWASRITDSIRSLCTRYGITRPSNSDPRYTFASWEGQAFRRVDFTANDGVDYMVVGALMPRMDKKRWREGTPYNRAVYVESEDRDTITSLICPRGLFFPSSRSLAVLGYPLNLEPLVHDLTLAIAWVCEARALFPERMVQE